MVFFRFTIVGKEMLQKKVKLSISVEIFIVPYNTNATFSFRLISFIRFSSSFLWRIFSLSSFCYFLYPKQKLHFFQLFIELSNGLKTKLPHKFTIGWFFHEIKL